MGKGRELHGQAEVAREQGDFSQALTLAHQALIAYQQERDMFGFCDALSSCVITLKHLQAKTQDNAYLTLAKHMAQAAVEIARENPDASVRMMPLMSLGRVQDAVGAYPDAAQSYEEAVNIMQDNPPHEHNRPAVLADMKIHMEVAKLRSGDTSAYDRTLQAVTELEATDEDAYNKDVWLSGAHMKLAEALLDKDKEKASEHLKKAKQIIDANHHLALRQEQWEKLSQSFQ